MLRGYQKKLALAFAGTVAFIIVWHLMSTRLLPQGSALPPPTRVVSSMIAMWRTGELVDGAVESIKRIVLGFAIALLIAVCFSIMAARFTSLYTSVKPVLDLLSSIPPIAWTPLAIMWFGIGDVPALFIVTLGAFFPMFAGFYSGITRVDQDLISVAKTLGASPTRVVAGVIFPAALPTIFTGMRTGLTVAWFNVIAAELIGVRSGLGYQIQLNRSILFSEAVIALMLVIGVIGLIMTRMMSVVGNLASPWAIQDETRSWWVGLRRRISRSLHHAPDVTGTRAHLHQCQPNDPTDVTLAPPPKSRHQPDSNSTVLVVEHLSKSFGDRTYGEKIEVLRDISFHLKKGEIVAVVGPNGSGKTTLLNIVASLLEPSGGEVRFKGERVRVPGRERSIVFQNFALFPFYTCRGNIKFAARSAGLLDGRNVEGVDSIDCMVHGLLREMRLTDFAEAYPAELSGGMKQRLAIARALAASPELILLDEPFSAYDPLLKNEGQQLMLKTISARSLSLLLVTHDLDEAIFMSDRVIVLNERPASVEEIIDINLPRPRASEIRRSREFDDLHTHLQGLLARQATISV
jgi:NitT/TauT family transport system ATP-binding protein